jgi:hypothetical protein
MVAPLHGHQGHQILTLLNYYLWGHMKTFMYEVTVDLRATLCHCVFAAAAEHRCNCHDYMASTTQSMLVHAKKFKEETCSSYCKTPWVCLVHKMSIFHFKQVS